jgi:PAS domain S-box-containing protein
MNDQSEINIQSPAIRVLLIEDNPGDIRLIREMLGEIKNTDAIFSLFRRSGGYIKEMLAEMKRSKAFEINDVDKLSTGLEDMSREGIDVILLDLGLPDSQGLKTLTRALEKAGRVPIVVLTGLADENIGVMAVKEGAQDYLIKGQITRDLLIRSMSYAIERNKTEKTLKESEEKYRALMNDAGDAIVLADTNGNVLEVNKKAEELLGYTKEELSNMNIAQIHPEEELERIIAAFKVSTTLNDGQVRRKDDKIVPVDITRSVIEYAGKKVILGIFRDITEHKRVEEQIRASLKEKEVLLQEIHHRVKNNMQIISSLLNLQAGYIEDKKYLDMFQESQNRISTMSLVHEKLYRSKDFTKINFKDYTINLANGVFQSFGGRSSGIMLNLNIDDVEIGIDSAIPCGLIINELVTNSLKYAFPGEKKGEIKIVLGKKDGNEYELTVSDNGIGFPEDIDFSKTETLGLHLVSMLAEHQLSGKINLDRSRGTEFSIIFREKK